MFTRDALAYVHRNQTPKRARLAVAAVDREDSTGSAAARVNGTASIELPLDVDTETADLVESYARMRTLMSAVVPSGSMVRAVRPMTADAVGTSEGRQGQSYRSLLTLALTGSGDPAGYTMLFVPIGDEANLLQDDTYVMREHRGHRFGEQLKWANLAQARAISPDAEWIHTYTEQGNTAMQRTNRDFGFVPVEVMHEVQLTF